MFKYLLIAGLSFAALNAQANEVTTGHTTDRVQFGTVLDIAKVINKTDGTEVNGIIPIQLSYQDSRGEQHAVQYDLMAEGTSG
jgi:hypothetical protein